MKAIFLPILLLGFVNFCFGKNKTYKSLFPLGFYENKGQIIDQNNKLNPSVKFLWNGNGMKVQLKGNSFSYEVQKSEKFEYRISKSEILKHRKTQNSDSIVTYIHRVDIELLNANLYPQIIAEEKSADYDNYYTTGTPEEGVTFVYHYGKVTYKDIYHNIDLEFISDAKNKMGFKYNFIVRPGGDMADIQLQYQGATNINLNKQGNLAVTTTSGDFEESIPKSYVAETGENVTVQYAAKGGNIFGFQTNSFITNQTLIIDPWCTYYGGNNDYPGGISCNSNNEVLVTGGVNSTTTNIIATTGSFQNTFGGGASDGFFATFTHSGSRLYGTYYGGNNLDALIGNYDKWGNIYVAGYTESTNGIATTGSYQSSLMGTHNGLLAKFSSSGVRIWGTYLGGSIGTGSYCTSLTIDSSGNPFVAGETTSLINIATTGAYQTVKSGASNSTDAYVMKFDSSGMKIWGSYFGGSLDEYGLSIKNDNNSNLFITGLTLSQSGVATIGAHQTTIGSPNDEDAFLAKFNNLGQIQWATYYGGGQPDGGNNVCTNLLGDVFLVGGTSSTNNISTSNSYQSSIQGGGDGFLVKFNSSGVRQWGTYYGGNSGDELDGVITDANGNIFICGETYSTNGIATSGAFQPNLIGSSDAILAKFNSTGSRLWGSYFGGNSTEFGGYITIDGIGNILLDGDTYSQTGIATIGASQTTPGGIFIASFDSTGSLSITPPVSNNTIVSSQTICSNVLPTLLTGSSPTGGSGIYGYLWLQSTTNATSGFTAATGANNNQNYQPPLLSVTTWYKRIVTSGNAADTTTAVQLTVNTAPVANVTAGSTTTFCQGNSVTFNANTGAGFNYQWYEGATAISGATNATYLATTSGSYTVQISNSNNCTDTSNIITVTVNPVPTASITAGGNTTICNGEGVNLNAQTGTGYTYQWYHGNTLLTGATNATFLATASGSYTVIVNLGSCSDTSNAIVVTVNALPSVSITQTVDTFYSNGSFNGYQWYLNGTAIAGATNPNYTATQNGNYFVIVIDANNCSGQSNTILFTVGIEELGEGHLLSVSPNPFKESLVVHCASAKGTIIVSDLIGKILVSLSLSKPQTTIDMKGYATGVYLLQYDGGEVCETVKFVKE